MIYKSLEETARLLLDRRAMSESLLEEVKKRQPSLLVLQHDKQTGNMSYIHKHPKSKDHVIYSSMIDGTKGEVILHRKHIEQMINLLNPQDEKK